MAYNKYERLIEEAGRHRGSPEFALMEPAAAILSVKKQFKAEMELAESDAMRVIDYLTRAVEQGKLKQAKAKWESRIELTTLFKIYGLTERTLDYAVDIVQAFFAAKVAKAYVDSGRIYQMGPAPLLRRKEKSEPQ